MSNERLIDVSVAARVLGTSRSTVYRHLNEGNLSRVKTGVKKGYKIKYSEVINLKSNRGY